jgi:hypothetical protein
MLGRLFGRNKTPAPPVSSPEVFAAFFLAQFLPEFQWQIPKADLEAWARASGPEFEDDCRMWILIYLSWMFRGAVTQRYGEQFWKDVMTALRVRIAKIDPQQAGPMVDLPRLLEFWYPKLDFTIQNTITTTKPAKAEDAMTGLLYSAAVSFIALGTAEDSPWHKNPDVPHDLIMKVTISLAEALDFLRPKLQNIVDIVSKPPR